MVSSVVVAELWFGIRQSAKITENEAALDDFLAHVSILDWPRRAAPTYATVRDHLKRRGKPIRAMDLLMASHALCGGSVLVTDNVKEFGRVPNLKVENWVRR